MRLYQIPPLDCKPFLNHFYQGDNLMFSTWFDRVRSVPILDVINFLGIPFSNNGRSKIRSRCILPNHSGPNKSGTAFAVNTDLNVWYCHGCEVGGGNIELVSKVRGLEVIESADLIAEHAKFESFEEVQAATPEQKQKYRKQIQEKALVHEILTTAAHHFHRAFNRKLRNSVKIPQGKFAPKNTWQNIYHTWGMTDDLINDNLIGFDNNTLLKVLQDRGYTTEQILKSGLFYCHDDGTVGDSVFRTRITFPYIQSGQITNFIARSTDHTYPCYKLDPGAELEKTGLPYAKYKKIPLHSDARPYISSTITTQMFGIYDIRRCKNAVIVEGITDVVMLRHFFKTLVDAGVKDARTWGIGSFLSNQVTNDHIQILTITGKTKDTLIFLCDNERSGWGSTGAIHTAEKLLKKKIQALIGKLPLPESQDKIDPAIWVRDNLDRIGTEPKQIWREFTGIVQQSRNLVDIALDKSIESLNEIKSRSSRAYLSKIRQEHAQEILDLVVLLPELQQDDYLSALTEDPFKLKMQKLKRMLKQKQESKSLLGSTEINKPQEQSTKFSIDGIIPDDWEVNSTGMWKEVVVKQTQEVQYVKVSEAPMVITAKYRDIDTGQNYLKSEYYEQGQWIPRTESREIFMSSRQLPNLAKWGFPTTTENAKHIVNFLAEYEASNRDRIKVSQVVSSCGNKVINDERAFVLGKQCIYKDRIEPIEFLTPDVGDLQVVNAFEPVGKFDAWKDMVKKCIDYPGVMFSIYTAFVSPFLGMLKSRGFTLHLWGRTSIGKTVTLWTCSSVWGDPTKLSPSWNQKIVAVERRMALCNQVGIFLDELKEEIKKDFTERVLYAVTNGVGRGRGSLKGMQKILTWLLIMMSTGEYPITQSSTDEGGQARAINIRGHLFGEGNRELAHHLEICAKSNYGFAGPYFLQHANVEKIKERHKYYLDLICRLAKTDVAYRVGKNIAVILAVGDEVNRVFGLHEGTALDIVGDLVLELLQDATSIDRGNAALAQVTEWALANEDMFYPHADLKKDIAGVWKEGEYLAFFPHRLEEILKKFGYNYDAIIRDWRDRNWIKTEGHHNTCRYTINNKRVRLLSLYYRILEL